MDNTIQYLNAVVNGLQNVMISATKNNVAYLDGIYHILDELINTKSEKIAAAKQENNQVG